ncbi:hypothetical protein BV20DRAFT_961198 [Pilatotrama ljubarskyi]|nr:hypothetical protein BV20DRAFT_961198 [Pilatotrama ljubarskyi]
MAATRTALQKVSKEVFEGKPPTLHIELSGLPRTALPHDLRRLCGKNKVENVANVAIDYKRFRPSGNGLLSFARLEHAAAAHKALDNAVVGGKRVTARRTSTVPEIPRARGPKGILEAAERGAVSGNGPSGGITGSGRNVVLYGLPGKMLAVHLVDGLRNFKLAGTEYGREVVVKMDATGRLTSSSRFLVRLSTVSEAYRLVRRLHMQPWRPDLFGDRYSLRAFVVW